MSSQNSIKAQLLERALSVAHHEMGHYVVARALGFSTGDVTISINGPPPGHSGTSGVKLAAPAKNLDKLQRYLERRVIVLYAGTWAEVSYQERVNPVQGLLRIEDRVKGAEQDHAKVQELIHVLRNVRYPDTDPSDDATTQLELNTLKERLWEEARQLVDRFTQTITLLAEILANRVDQTNKKFTLDAAELERLPEVRAIPRAEPSGDSCL